MRKNLKVKSRVLCAVTAVVLLSGLGGCGGGGEEKSVVVPEMEEISQPVGEESREDISSASAGEDLDVAVPDAADDDWYRKGNIYSDADGRNLEVFFDDEGELEFAFDGLSVYRVRADSCQLENDWRIYTCDDGTMIIYYPGNPAHIEVSDGDYAGLYEAGGDKKK